ncbi:MAG: tetratricopeptide repeat protein [bacterium]
MNNRGMVLKKLQLILFIVFSFSLVLMLPYIRAQEKAGDNESAWVADYAEKLRRERKFEELEDLAANRFSDAKRLYNRKQYSEAGLRFKEVVYLFPNFSRVDEACYLMGESFYRADDYDDAREAFTRLVNTYPNSEYHKKALFRLETVAHKQERYTEAIFYHQKILMLFPDADFIDHANYIGGICRYSIGEFDEAVEVLDKIPATSEFYGFAQYTKALCLIQRDDLQGAIEQFKRILTIKESEFTTRALKDLARLTLGRVYYELGNFEEALTQYKDIPSSDAENYDDAILGIGWVYIKLNDYEKAVKYFRKIVNEMPQSDLVAEARLSLGHCYLGLDKYSEAIDVYKYIMEHHSLAAELAGDPRVTEIFQGISDEMTRVDTLYYNLVELDKIALSKGRDDLHRKITSEKDEIKRLQDLLAGLEMWFSGRSTTGRNLMLGAEFGMATVAFEKEQNIEIDIVKLSQDADVKTKELLKKEEEYERMAEEEVTTEKEKVLGWHKALTGAEGISVMEEPPVKYEPGMVDFSKEKRKPMGLPSELEGVTYNQKITQEKPVIFQPQPEEKPESESTETGGEKTEGK